MFFYTPNGRIPLTYSFFFEKRLFQETYLENLQKDLLKEDATKLNKALIKFITKQNSAYRLGSVFNYYYSDPLFFSVDISSNERFISDKYVFFMFFIKEILKESSIYISFLESNFFDFSKAETFLTKRFNTIFLNLFYKFYQAPAIINY